MTRPTQRTPRKLIGGFLPRLPTTTSLASKSETEVVCMEFRPHLRRHHLPCMQQRDGGGFMAFRPHSRCHHLPRMQERDGGGFLGGFDPVYAASTSLACKSETEVGLMSFQPRSRCRHLPRMQQRDGGGVYVVSTPFASPPPPSHCKSETEVDF